MIQHGPAIVLRRANAKAPAPSITNNPVVGSGTVL